MAKIKKEISAGNEDPIETAKTELVSRLNKLLIRERQEDTQKIAEDLASYLGKYQGIAPTPREKAMLLWPAMMKFTKEGNWPLEKENANTIWENVKTQLRETSHKEPKKPKDTKTKVINFGKLLLNVLLPPVAIIRQFNDARSVDKKTEKLRRGNKKNGAVSVGGTQVVSGTAMLATYAGLGVAGLFFAMKFYNPLMQTPALSSLTGIAALPIWQLALVGLGLCILGRTVGWLLGETIFLFNNSKYLNQSPDLKDKFSVWNMLKKSLKYGFLGSSAKGLSSVLERPNEILAELAHSAAMIGTGGFEISFRNAFVEGEKIKAQKAEEDEKAKVASLLKDAKNVIAQSQDFLGRLETSQKADPKVDSKSTPPSSTAALTAQSMSSSVLNPTPETPKAPEKNPEPPDEVRSEETLTGTSILTTA